MHATEEVIDTKVSHYEAHQGKDRIDAVVTNGTEPRQTLRMERHAIDKKRYQCPCLLWIPAPVCSPRDICPHGTKEYARRKGKDCRTKSSAIERAYNEQTVADNHGSYMNEQHWMAQHRHEWAR